MTRQDRLSRAGRWAALLLFAGTTLSTTGVAAADQLLPLGGGWQTYVNDRYGMRFDYPAHVFKRAEPAEGGEGRTFFSSDASLQIMSRENDLGYSPRSMMRDVAGNPDYREVTYNPSGRSWLVISGFRDENIYYEKYFFRGGLISAFAIEFPRDRKPFYAPLIERIEDSFRAGR